jgi:nitrogen regulatory protein PII
MYKIEAIVRRDRLNSVKEALVAQGFEEFAVADVHGHGCQPPAARCYRGVTFEVPYTQHAQVELSVPETALELAIDCIAEAASTGESAGGKILVTTLADAIEVNRGDQFVFQPYLTPRRRLAAAGDAAAPSAR